MAVRSKVGLSGDGFVEAKPKKTRQGSGKHTKYAATSRNGKKKMYRGQPGLMGRWIHKGGKSKPDKRCKNVLTPKKCSKPKKKR